jgi:glycerol-3-phosphate acyltransferase PlsY
MSEFLVVVVAVLAAYLLGSVPFAVVCSRLFGIADPRSYGSKNPGATNVLRSGNKAAAASTLLGDMAKGWLAVFLAQRYGPKFWFSQGLVGVVALAVFSAIFFRYSSSSRAARVWRRAPGCCWASTRRSV